MNFLLVGAGGFIGALFRFYLSTYLDRHCKGSFSIGLLAVNILGCFLMGALMAFLSHDFDHKHTRMLMFLSLGGLASFTTFSSFAYQTLRLLQANQYLLALTNIGAHLGLGLIAVALGIFLIEHLVNFS